MVPHTCDRIALNDGRDDASYCIEEDICNDEVGDAAKGGTWKDLQIQETDRRFR